MHVQLLHGVHVPHFVHLHCPFSHFHTFHQISMNTQHTIPPSPYFHTYYNISAMCMIHWSPCTQHTILLRIKTTLPLFSYLEPYLCNAIIFLHRRRLPPWNETSDTIISKAGTIDDVNQTQHTASSAMMFTVFSNTISVQIHQDTT